MVCCMCCGDVCFKKPLLQQHSGGHMGALGSLGSLGSLGPRRLPVGWPSGCAYAWYSPLLAAAAPGLKRHHRHPGTSAALSPWRKMSKSTCFWWECQWRSWKRMGLGWGYAHFFSSLLSTLIIIYMCKLHETCTVPFNKWRMSHIKQHITNISLILLVCRFYFSFTVRLIEINSIGCIPNYSIQSPPHQ